MTVDVVVRLVLDSDGVWRALVVGADAATGGGPLHMVGTKRRATLLAPTVASTRDSLVPLYGSYEPVEGDTAGLTDESILTNYNDPASLTVTIPSGPPITNKIIWGDASPASTFNSDTIIRNCLWRGGPNAPTSDISVIRADVGRTGLGMMRLFDCEVRPQHPALLRDGIRGRNIEVHRTYIHDTIDGFFGYSTAAQNGGVSRARLYGSVIKNLRYGFPDYNNGTSGATQHSDGTHNDCVVIGGKDVIVKGNSLWGTATNLPGTVNGVNPTHPQLQAAGYTNGACVIIGPTGTPPDLTTIIEQNYMRGGLAHFNVKANMTATVRDNRHYRAVFVDPNTADGNSSSGYWVRYDQRAGNGVVVVNSVWIDGPYAGQVLVEPRDRGVHFNV